MHVVGHPMSHLLEKVFIHAQLRDVNPGRGQGFIWHPTSPIPCSESQVCPRTIKAVLPILVLTCEKYHALHTCTTSMFAFRNVGAGNKAIKFEYPYFFLSGLSKKCFERC